MPDEPDQPRKIYGFKPREFETVNGPPRVSASGTTPPSADPKTVSPPTAGPIDVRELARAAAGNQAALGHNAPAPRDNEIHALLRQQLAHDQAAGRYAVIPGDDKKRRRRIRNYWILLLAVDAPLGFFAWKIGHQMAIPFVFAVGGIGMFTAWWTWETWALRTE